MVGNIIKKGKFDPDSCFDPVTHIATEDDFIKLLKNKVYDSKYIGYFVRLSNTVDYNNGLYKIADVNHDSANTGQTNCYDLISVNCFYQNVFTNSYYWRNSLLRAWLNNNFYPGFSDKFKTHIMNIKYNSENTWYNDDKVISPSYTEVTNSTSDHSAEGVVYPIFTDDNSRKKYQFNTSTIRMWWTRSAYTANYWYTICVTRSGGTYPGHNGDASQVYSVALLRVS